MNMEHCKFENTYSDLLDCRQSLDDAVSVESLEEEANRYEKPYIRKLIELCEEIAANYGENQD